MTIWLQYAGDSLTGNGTDTITSTGFSGAAHTDDAKAVGVPWQFEVKIIAIGSSWSLGTRLAGYALSHYRDPGELIDGDGNLVTTGPALADGDVLTISYDGNVSNDLEFRINDVLIGTASNGDTFGEATRGYAYLGTSGQTIQGVWAWLTHPVAGVDVWDANAPTLKIEGIGPGALLDAEVSPTREDTIEPIGPGALLGMTRAPELVLIGPGPLIELTARNAVAILAPIGPAPLFQMERASSLDPIAPGPLLELEVLPATPVSLDLVGPAPALEMVVTPGQILAIDLVGAAPLLEMGQAPRLDLIAPGAALDLIARPSVPARLDLIAPGAVLDLIAYPSGPLLAFATIGPAPDGFEIPLVSALDLIAPGPLLELVITPSGVSGQALVVNITTGHATRYAGFGYRRLFQAGARVLGVGDGGLEDLFRGDPVAWSFRTAPALLNAERVAIVDSLYLDVRSSSPGTATATITYDADHPGDFVAQMPRRGDFDIARVKLGKSLRGHRADVRLAGTTAIAVRGLSLRLLGKGRKL